MTSTADQAPTRGCVFQKPAGTVSAARNSLFCARASFSMMGSSKSMTLATKLDWIDPNRVLQPGSARGLESLCQLQDAALAKRRAENLQAHRQLSTDLSARHGNPRHSRQRSRNRINISKIHLQRAVRPFTQLKGRNWGV